MSIERGHQSIYFKDIDTLKALDELTAKEDMSVSHVVNEVMKAAVPEIIKQLKKGGKREEMKLTLVVNL